MLVDTLLYKWRGSHDILNALAFSTDLIAFLWATLRTTGTTRAVLDQSSAVTSIDSTRPAMEVAFSSPTSFPSSSLLSSVVPLFCSCYAHLLPVLTDAEFFGDDLSSPQPHSLLAEQPTAGFPIPLQQQAELVAFLVALAYRMYWVEEAPQLLTSLWSAASASSPPSLLASYQQRKVRDRLRARISSVLTLLRDRQSRRSFTSEDTWLMHMLPFATIEAEIRAAQPQPSTAPSFPSPPPSPSSSASPSSRASRLFSSLPFVFPFQSRLRYFYERVEAHKAELGHSVIFAAGRGLKATIRRSHLLEDGYRALHGVGDQLKGRVAIEFVDANGATEPGVDGGGLFREFVSQLIKGDHFTRTSHRQEGHAPGCARPLLSQHVL